MLKTSLGAALLALVIVITTACNVFGSQPNAAERVYPVKKTEAEWKKSLTAAQFRILREKGTERPFSGKYWNEKREGVYQCAGCGAPLFHSRDKFKSGTGWPSYTQPIDPKNVATELDRSLGVVRTEIICARCGGHLGHVFNDGPEPTGLRYCVNSASLDLKPASKKMKPKP